MVKLSQNNLIILSSLFFVLFYNFKFFEDVISVYGLSGLNIIYIASTAIVIFFLNVFLISLFSSKYTTKAILIVLFIVSSFTAYFMDSYYVIIDSEMIRNSLQTNLNESLDLLSLKLVVYFFFLGLLPSYFIYKVKLEYKGIGQEILSKIKTILLSLVIILLIIFSFSKFYTSFFREHKPLRYNVNPTYWIYSTYKYIDDTFYTEDFVLKDIGLDAKINKTYDEKNNLMILVVGEALRADKFSLNTYEKDTNPLLKKEKVISFSNMYSCGTSTAHSVPCMFSIFNRNEYTYKKGISTKNVLDVLQNTEEVSILWRENNSDSKGVALRVAYEDFKHPSKNTICNPECRDEGMLIGLEDYINKNKGKNILIVLHQMGNHGPAYYKRYPKEFEKFTPICKTNQLENCSKEEINNAYDNAVLYTDYFLSKAINFLKHYEDDYETYLFYISDHGESLGENGIYLHGMPYLIAPKEQKHIASFLWLGNKQSKYDKEILLREKDKEYSQDNLFHTILGIFEVESEVYNKDLDLLYKSKIKQ